MIELTQQIVRELINYEPETGDLFWRERSISWFTDGPKNKKESCQKSWNAKNAGKKIGTFDKSNGYLKLAIFDKRYYSHRIIWLWMTGEWPEQVDHENGIRTDNRWCNLRSVSAYENGSNQNFRKNNTSGYKGVTFDKRYGKWMAVITINGKCKNLGYRDEAKDAFDLYCLAAEEIGRTKRHIFGDGI